MQPDRTAELTRLMERRILVLDGAMGTMIQQLKLGEADFRGPASCGLAQHTHDLKGDNDLLVLTQPQAVARIHDAYLAAGADLIETNTFNATAIAQAEYALSDRVREINRAAAAIARAAADRWTARTPDRPRFVAGALGPTSRTASISPDVNDPGARNVTFDELVAAYREAADGLIDGGADLLLVETVFDTLNAKAALFAIDEAFEARGARLPVIVSGTITDASGRTLSGQTPTAFWHSVRHAKPLAVGLNCALGAALHAPLHRGDRAGRRHLRQLLPQCRAAQPDVRDRLRRDAAGDGPPRARLREERLRQHHRRLLRHHARAHPRDRRRRGRRAAAIAHACPARGGGLMRLRASLLPREPGEPAHG